MITVKINGKLKQFSGPRSLEQYLQELGVTQRHIAIAYNGNVIRKNELAEVILADGDKLEIVRAVGGG